ncbi:MAG: DUF4139 domain-containing protein [Treponema sp.]|nr:DUF4139 domain-containing protein [Treponema sp.]
MRKYLFLSLAVLLAGGAGLSAQAVREARGGAGPAQAAAGAEKLPLKKLALYSSGVGFFERRGTLPDNGGSAETVLSFPVSAVNDVLKSLVITGGGSAPVTVSYSSFFAPGNFRIDLGNNPDIAEILRRFQGEEIEINAPNPLRGRILAVEYRDTPSFTEGTPLSRDVYLSLFSPSGINVINLKDISSFNFVKEETRADLSGALDRIAGSRNDESRDLRVTLPGAGGSEITISYVIPSPVWKVSYRLDLSGTEPLFQGWAMIDNDSGTDWDNIELSLVSGRPVSFIQNLYPPYHVGRPVLPLAIAGAAAGRTYDSALSFGSGSGAEEEREAALSTPRNRVLMESVTAGDSEEAAYAREIPVPAAKRAVTAGGTAATGSGLADQFEFTLKQPVTIKAGKSSMLPLVEATVTAAKTLVFSGADAAQAQARGGGAVHPGISAEITNTTGMRLPPGPITVYDGGSYAGDALIEFFPEKEKRIVSYGDDLSVSGTTRNSGERRITAVTVSRGIMTVKRSQSYETLYLLRNASEESKALIIEHPVTAGTTLAEPVSFSERTDTVYRFKQTLKSGEELSFTVREERPVLEQVALARTQLDSWLGYSSGEEIPANVREALRKGAELKRGADEAKAALAEIERGLKRLEGDEERIRKNLEAAGRETPQGRDYLLRLVSLDNEIDALGARREEAGKTALALQKEYENYLDSMSF